MLPVTCHLRFSDFPANVTHLPEERGSISSLKGLMHDMLVKKSTLALSLCLYKRDKYAGRIL